MSNPVGVKSSIALPKGFEFNEVRHPAPSASGSVATLAAPVPPPDLGPLAQFTGSWTGSGFNSIFRPSRQAGTDNILELNLTSESLTFSNSLGSVPNRGMVQGDIFLNGVPYLQAVNDVTDPHNTIGIHVEPGLWMMVPPTSNPSEGETFVRMASIPHGTTIQAQGTSSVIAGAPLIPPVDMTPFFNSNHQKQHFPSQVAATPNAFRIPENLAPFIAAGTITQAILDDPNTVLRQHLSGLKVVSTTQITIHTNPPVAPTVAANPTIGGGTDNIAFLAGNGAPNAASTQLTATFWIETVEHTVNFPVFHPGQAPVVLPRPIEAGIARPPLSQIAPKPILAPKTIKFQSKQIQYSQTVFLNFNGLTWPHVSVATLLPADPVTVPASAWD